MFPSFSPYRSRAQSSAPPSPFAFTPTAADTETLYADPWHGHGHGHARTSSLVTPTWSPESHTSSNSSSEHSSPNTTPTSPCSGSEHEHEHEHEHERTKKLPKEKKSTNTNTNTNTKTASSKSKRSKHGDSEKPQKMVLGKTGKPILAASLKRQLRRQKARARAEPRFIELATGEKLGLGQRRSKYTAILEKLNQDLARVQTELTQEKQRNQHLDETVQHLSEQLNQQTSPSPSLSTKLQSYHTASQIKSQLMHQHSSQSIYDFFKMSSPVMLVLLDFNLRVLDANQTYLRENGWTRDELIGRRLPIIHMCMFFIPGYDQKQIPIDENDIPPLHAGLPRGIPAEEMHAQPVNYHPVYHNLYRGKAESITVRDTYLDGKGRLFKSSITHWLAYYKPEDDNVINDTARFASDSSSMTSIRSSSSSYVYSRPSTAADEAFRALFGKPNPPYLPHKGYPKYHVAMESAYDREYITPIASTSTSTSPRPLHMWNSSPSGHSSSSRSSHIREADSESDSDDEHMHQQDQTNVIPWTDNTQPLHTIAKIADKVTAWRRTIRANRAATSTSTPIGINSPGTHTHTHTRTHTITTTTTTIGSSSLSSSMTVQSSGSSSVDDDIDIDEDLLLPPINPSCADACAIVSVLVQKAQKVTSIRKMINKQELEEPVMEEDGNGDGNGDGHGHGHEYEYEQSTTAKAIQTVETMKTNRQQQYTITAQAQPQPQPQRQVQVQIPRSTPVPVPISLPVHTPIQTLSQPSPSTPFPPSPSPYSPLDLPLSLPTPSSSSSSSSSSIPPVYDSDPDQDMWMNYDHGGTTFPPSLPLTSQSSYESQTRTTFPFRAPSPFSIWGN